MAGRNAIEDLVNHPTDIGHSNGLCIHLKLENVSPRYSNIASIASARGRGNRCRPVGETSGQFVLDASQARSPLIQYDMGLDESQPAWSAQQPVTSNHDELRKLEIYCSLLLFLIVPRAGLHSG